MNRPTRDTAAGRAYLELQRRARSERRNTQELLILYVVERWLARLSASPYADQFVLKGGMLLAAFGARRPTVDMDTLARNFANDEATVRSRVAAIADHPIADDGVQFRTETMTTRVIRDEELYSGIRVAMVAMIATAKVRLQLDINFGDPVTPAPRIVEIESLRTDSAPIRILGYPLETVLAEKIATAISLGSANTRVRDYADVHILTQLAASHGLTHAASRNALVATAAYRGTDLVPLSTVVDDLARTRAETYTAYRKGLDDNSIALLPTDFDTVVTSVCEFADALATDSVPESVWNTTTHAWTATPTAARAPGPAERLLPRGPGRSRW